MDTSLNTDQKVFCQKVTVWFRRFFFLQLTKPSFLFQKEHRRKNGRKAQLLVLSFCQADSTTLKPPLECLDFQKGCTITKTLIITSLGAHKVESLHHVITGVLMIFNFRLL